MSRNRSLTLDWISYLQNSLATRSTWQKSLYLAWVSCGTHTTWQSFCVLGQSVRVRRSPGRWKFPRWALIKWLCRVSVGLESTLRAHQMAPPSQPRTKPPR